MRYFPRMYVHMIPQPLHVNERWHTADGCSREYHVSQIDPMSTQSDASLCNKYTIELQNLFSVAKKESPHRQYLQHRHRQGVDTVLRTTTPALSRRY